MSDHPTKCLTCEAIAFLAAWVKWDDATRAVWEAWEKSPDYFPEAEEPPGYEVLWQQRPQAPRGWLNGATDYEDMEFVEAVRWLECARPDCPTSKAAVIAFPVGGQR